MELYCIIIDDEPHAISELSDLIADVPYLHLLSTFTDAREAISYLQQNDAVDFVFSDINLPGISGIDSARLLKKYCRFLIFVSAHREFALEAFGVSANAYLIKPVSRTVFMEKIDELTDQLKSAVIPAAGEQVLFIKGNSKNSFTKIDPGKIIFIEGMLNYVVIHTEGEKYITYMGLKDILQKLAPVNFMRVNKSIIISLKHISHVDGNVVFLSNKMNYTIGNSFKNAFRDYIAKRTLNDS
jgi:DNA-binding LytR/AlgR family response regulator